MSNDSKVRRTLHFRFTVAAANPAQIAAHSKALAPWYELWGATRVQLLQNVDDPGKFIQVIDYEALEAVERGRQQIASDQRVQGYLQAWRALLPGAVEVDVYRELDS